MLRFQSPYLDLGVSCRWLRGNHHGHSTVSDGEDDPLVIAQSYESAGYDYLAFSEHDRVLPAEDIQPHTQMCIVPAVEVTSCYRHTLLYLGADHVPPKGVWTPRQIMEHVHAAGGLFIFDHPNWRPWPDYCTDEMLDSMAGLRGMEIYTGVIERLPGEAKATDRWDRLLSLGWRVFGHGTDDQHRRSDQFIAWNCVQWPEAEAVTWPGIVAALSAGRFYASTGVTIREVGVLDGGQVITLSSDADELRWITWGGVIVKKEAGGSGTLSLAELARSRGTPKEELRENLYVRLECLGHGNKAAWSQPFWIEEE
jgi:hypothetical protein